MLFIMEQVIERYKNKAKKQKNRILITSRRNEL